jgi:hypothetical protein
MTPRIDFVTATWRGLGDSKPFNLESKLVQITRTSRLFTATRLGFSWMGWVSEGSVEAFSAGKTEVKKIEGPFIFMSFGSKLFKFMRLSDRILEGKATEKIWRRWFHSGVASIGKGCQTAVFAKQAVGLGGMGFAADIVVVATGTITSLIDVVHRGLKCVDSWDSNNNEQKKYLLLKLIQGVMGLVCSIFSFIGLFFAFLQPVAPLTFMLLGTACLVLNIARYYFKKEAVETISKMPYNNSQYMRCL